MGGLSFRKSLKNTIIMKNYITRESLADFLEKMWDAGVRAELVPKKQRIDVYAEDYRSESIYVLDRDNYNSLVDGMIDFAKPKYTE